MATTVVIDDTEHELYQRIRAEIDEKAPYALIRSNYDGKTKKIIFQFTDSRYIPKELIPYVIVPQSAPPYDFSKIELP